MGEIHVLHGDFKYSMYIERLSYIFTKTHSDMRILR